MVMTPAVAARVTADLNAELVSRTRSGSTYILVDRLGIAVLVNDLSRFGHAAGGLCRICPGTSYRANDHDDGPQL
jgi:hypothetical protein